VRREAEGVSEQRVSREACRVREACQVRAPCDSDPGS